MKVPFWQVLLTFGLGAVASYFVAIVLLNIWLFALFLLPMMSGPAGYVQDFQQYPHYYLVPPLSFYIFATIPVALYGRHRLSTHSIGDYEKTNGTVKRHDE